MIQHEQIDPIAVLDTYERAMHAGDIDAVIALFDDAHQWPAGRGIVL